MEIIEIFIALVGAHFIADYVFQTDSIATGKNRNIDPAKFGVNWYYWMTAHAATHGAAVALITGNIWLGLAESVAHFIIDWCKCEKLFGLHVDQLLHILCKLVWVVILAL